MVKFTLYQKPRIGDWLHICHNLAADQIEQYEAFTGPYVADEVAVLGSLRQGPNWVLCADGEPVVIAGFDMVRPGVWQDYLLSNGPIWDRHWLTITKHVRKAMNAMLTVGGAHRLQCVSLASRLHAHVWIGCVGFASEGTLRSYGIHGEDAIMFARLRPEPDG